MFKKRNGADKDMYKRYMKRATMLYSLKQDLLKTKDNSTLLDIVQLGLRECEEMIGKIRKIDPTL